VGLENVQSWSGQFVTTESKFEGDGVAFDAGDILFGKLRPYLAKVWLADAPGEAVGDFHVLRPVDRLQGRFAQYQMLNRNFIEVIDGSTFGSKMPRASWESLGNMPFLVPALDDQKAIAIFLDRETAKIDALIAEQERLVALLAEKRLATISHAVTRGLNPAAPKRESGIAWFGQIPAHWTLSRLGRLSIERCDGPFGSGIKSEHYTEEGALVVRLQNIRAGTFHAGEPVYLDERYFQSELRGHEVLAGDVLVAGLGDENNLLGRACVAPDGLGWALVKADCFRFRMNLELVLPEFVALQLSAGAAFDAGMLSTGTTRSRIPLSTMATRTVAYPRINEQRAIVDFVKTETAKLDALNGAAVRAINLLRERRAALITAAVTGQIDVRHLVNASESTSPEEALPA
jgi:type I restriction enzyme S subunit